MTGTDPSRLRSRGRLLGVAAAALVLSACERKPKEPPVASREWREFEGSWTGAGSRRTIPLGDDRMGSIIDLRGTMLLAGSGRPGVGFRADVIALSDSDTGLIGRAVWTDEHGDQVFSELKGEGTREHNRITGTILGGAGRYAGATGSYEFAWQYVIESGDGSIQGRAVGMKGRYRIDPPAQGGAKQ